ncbi:MAG: hypothetical protein A2W23_05300 [Planctomycetes bacterium RBG_16_43_13]|nr:MAG: hypothetical protein A2W23_05300 [Planctomycetes bacterium RBG_16_43_13]
MEDKTRRVLIRVIGAPIILAILGGVLYWDYARKSHLGLMIIMAIFTAGGLWEFYNMCRLKGYNPARYVGIVVVILGSIFLIIRYEPDGLFARFTRYEPNNLFIYYTAIISIITVYLLIKIVFRYNKFSIIDASLTLIGFVYLTLWIIGIAYAVTVKNMFMRGDIIILYLFAVNKGSDMFAYCFGKLLGKTKLAPNVSPNKTVVGAVAGLIGGTTIGTLIASPFYPTEVGDYSIAIETSIVAAAAQLGDLVESVIKRWAGVKDSGHLLPEFGGFLDTIDSFLVSIPVFMCIMPLYMHWSFNIGAMAL